MKLAARLGIDVRFDSFDAKALELRGGFCTLRGNPVIVLDSTLPLLDKIGVLVEALKLFDLEAIYVPAVLRGLTATRSSNVRSITGSISTRARTGTRPEPKRKHVVKPLARPLARARAR